ncbi:hypothetical protein CFP56_022384 [Quercus suber]|uniref:RNase H type-1 domain-containing protein n=1 Tax=Quercus suber TaxID=58331 RepID=A0AAW0KF92_QUESU
MGQLLGRSETLLGLLECVVMICWGIWKNRNEIRHSGKDRRGTAIVKSSITLLDEFQAAIVKQMMLGPHKSEVGQYKVNTDGVVFTKRKWVGFGVAVHNSKGEA